MFDEISSENNAATNGEFSVLWVFISIVRTVESTLSKSNNFYEVSCNEHKKVSLQTKERAVHAYLQSNSYVRTNPHAMKVKRFEMSKNLLI